jgi:hypothetical protein
VPTEERSSLIQVVFYSALMRAASRIEVVNFNANVPDPWQSIAEHYHQAFQTGLILATQQPAAPSLRELHDLEGGRWSEGYRVGHSLRLRQKPTSVRKKPYNTHIHIFMT